MSFPHHLSRALGSLVLALALPALAASDTPRASSKAAAAPAMVEGLCRGAIQHPIEVTVRPLDPIRRGTTVRFQVQARARAPLANAEIRMVSTGGATASGPARRILGAIGPERSASGSFSVVVPRDGHRFLVQFAVRGEGPRGTITRGAVYNVLPDGPIDSGREVTASDGTRMTEFAARRIDR